MTDLKFESIHAIWPALQILSAKEKEWYPIIAGPARFKREWVLPIVQYAGENDEMPDLDREAQRIRQYIGVEPRDS